MPIAIVLSQVFFGIITFVISTFLILLVLVQRGRGGGLTGALGGPGGQSAFGTKAGDVFTKITIVTAALWIFFCALGVWWMQQGALPLGNTPIKKASVGVDKPNSAGANSSTGSSTGLSDGVGSMGTLNSQPESSTAIPPTQPTLNAPNSGSTPEVSGPSLNAPAIVPGALQPAEGSPAVPATPPAVEVPQAEVTTTPGTDK